MLHVFASAQSSPQKYVLSGSVGEYSFSVVFNVGKGVVGSLVRAGVTEEGVGELVFTGISAVSEAC